MPPRPALSQADAEILSAFFELSEERGQGMSGPLPITSAAVEAWLNVAGVGTRRRLWARCLRALDRVWREWAKEQAADGRQ